MSLSYRAVDWNPQKRAYDVIAGSSIVAALAVYIGVSLIVSPNTTAETLVIRGTALTAVLLLHVILCIGPLARLDSRHLPLLYNRRHLGVMMFGLALVHAVFSVIQFHAFGDANPLVSIFTAYRRDYRLIDNGVPNFAHFPFEPLGLAALAILFVMAATSHDFWLRNLGAPFWKAMHLGVYVAYALIIGHVALGVLQSERSVVYPLLVSIGFATVAGLHIAAANKERRMDRRHRAAEKDGFVATCSAKEVVEGRAKVVLVEGTRVAIWRHHGRLFATSNTCRHQGGPLGEGRIIDDCITCPWHGWNYQPEDGCSPPPFKEVIETYELKVLDGSIWLRPGANPIGTRSAGSVEEA